MAWVYILSSKRLGKYYTGSCLDLQKRLEEHRKGKYAGSFTSKSNDWELFHSIGELGYDQSRKIESHIKRMKSRRYIENLKKYPELALKLRKRYPNE